MCAPKDFFKAKHDDVDVPNLEVIKLMQSLESRGYIRTTFNWCVAPWEATGGCSCSGHRGPAKAPRNIPFPAAVAGLVWPALSLSLGNTGINGI